MITSSVDGHNGTYGFESTSTATQTYFFNAISVLTNLGGATTAPTSDDLTNYNQAINQLKDLAKGLVPGTTNKLDQPLTLEMAKSVATLLSINQSINSAFGDSPLASINNSFGFNSLDELNSWKDIYNQGGQPIVTGALVHSGATSTVTLQSYLQTNYITTGNNLLFAQLKQLQEALKVTQNALILLGNIQSLKNNAIVQSPTYNTASAWNAGLLPSLTFKGGKYTKKVNVNSVANIYKNQVGSSVGQQLLINIDPSFASSIETQGQGYVTQLQSTIASLNKISPPTNPPDPNSLASRLQTVLTGMTQPPAGHSIQWWVLDNYDPNGTQSFLGSLNGTGVTLPTFNTGNAGNYQRDLTNAITGAQNLNDSQKADLQTTMFNFQEFYQSASTVLSMINTFMLKMANQINKN